MISRALSRVVLKKENGRFSSTKSNCTAYCFEKVKTPVVSQRQNTVVPCTNPYLH